jgi:hypothetical protein
MRNHSKIEKIFNNGFDENEIRATWKHYFEKEELSEKEAVRLVEFFPNPGFMKPKRDKNGDIRLDKDGKEIIDKNKFQAFTNNNHIRKVEQLIERIENQMSYNDEYGCSLSSSIFDVVKKDTGKLTLSKATMKKSKTFIMDIDIRDKNGGRVHFDKEFSTIDHCSDTKEKIVGTVLAKINEKFVKQNYMTMPKPEIVAFTGGGFQLVFQTEDFINKEDYNEISSVYKKIIGEFDFPILVKDEAKKSVVLKVEIDSSGFDITHAQRIIGTINPKYDLISHYMDVDVEELQGKLQDTKKKLKNLYENHNKDDQNSNVAIVLDQYKFIKLPTGGMDIDMGEIRELNKKLSNTTKKSVQRDITKGNMSKEFSKKYENRSSVELEILRTYNNGKTIKVLDELNYPYESDGTNYKLICPFHEESNPSMELYANSGLTSTDIYYDFHNETAYDIIDIYMAITGNDKRQTVFDLINIFGYKVNKTQYKEVNAIQYENVVDEVLGKIETEDYIYYKLSDSQKKLVVRNIRNGERFVYDGTKSLIDTFVKNTGKVAPKETKMIISNKFENEILEYGFESFRPGEEPIIRRKTETLINTWIETDTYKRVKSMSSKFKSMEMKELVSKIKTNTPHMWNLISQLVQEGNREWFLNWLSVSMTNQNLPTLPIFFGTQGVGKNVFAEFLKTKYFGEQYVKVVSTDEMTGQFNSFMGESSLIVVDESKINGNAQDHLKRISGNSKIKVEKKGQDSNHVDKKFNLMLFSNRSKPAYITGDDRRYQFFHSPINLIKTAETLGYSDEEEFINNAENEAEMFFALLLKLKYSKKIATSNVKDRIFYKQVLRSHPFGEIVMNLIDETFDDMIFLMGESISSSSEMEQMMKEANAIRTAFDNDEILPLPVITGFLKRMKSKTTVSITQFGETNRLWGNGLERVISSKMTGIKIDKSKFQKFTEVEKTALATALSKADIEKNGYGQFFNFKDLIKEPLSEEDKSRLFDMDDSTKLLLENINVSTLSSAKDIYKVIDEAQDKIGEKVVAKKIEEKIKETTVKHMEIPEAEKEVYNPEVVYDEDENGEVIVTVPSVKPKKKKRV